MSKELDLFVTVVLLEDTPAVLAVGKLCEDHGKTYHWTSGEKPHLSKNGKRINCNMANYVPFVTCRTDQQKPKTPNKNDDDEELQSDQLQGARLATRVQAWTGR